MSTAAPTKTTDFSLARPRGTCAATGNAIEPDERFIAALRETPQGFERLDVKLDAWDGFDRADIVAFWKTAMPRTQAKRNVFVDDAVLCELLMRLGDTEQAEKLCFRFVLCLILMRRRFVTFIDSRRGADGLEVLTLKMRGRDGTFEVVDPKPTDEQIASVKDQLSQIVNEEL